MKKHESQKNDTRYTSDDNEVFVPEEFANLQKATGDNIGVKNYNIKSFPKFVRFAGYLFISLFVLFVIAAVIAVFFL